MSGTLYALFRSIGVSLWSLAGGTVIDLDHCLDYHLHKERPPRRSQVPRHFFDVMLKDRLERVYLLLHSWELVTGLLMIGWLCPARVAWAIPFGFGMGVHLLMDSFYLKPSVLRYSLVARWAHRFDGDFFYGGERRWREEARRGGSGGDTRGLPEAGQPGKGGCRS